MFQVINITCESSSKYAEICWLPPSTEALCTCLTSQEKKYRIIENVLDSFGGKPQKRIFNVHNLKSSQISKGAVLRSYYGI